MRERVKPNQNPLLNMKPKTGLEPTLRYDLSQNQEMDVQATEPPRCPDVAKSFRENTSLVLTGPYENTNISTRNAISRGSLSSSLWIAQK